MTKKRKRTGGTHLKAGVARVEAALLLRCLAHIASHGGVAEPDLREITGLSRASVYRLLAYAREQFGVVVAWRGDNTLPSHGEYSIEDWGVFNSIKVIARLKRDLYT